MQIFMKTKGVLVNAHKMPSGHLFAVAVLLGVLSSFLSLYIG